MSTPSALPSGSTETDAPLPNAWPTGWPPGGVVFWFRRDLRLHDAPALTHAVQLARQRGVGLHPVVVTDPAQTCATTAWGFARRGQHRAQWEVEAVAGLAQALLALGTPLRHLHGPVAQMLPALASQLGATELVCEAIPCPEELGQVAALRASGLVVHTVWASTLVAPATLPFAPEQVPDVFTTFRQRLETAGVREAAPLPTVSTWPTGPAQGVGAVPMAAATEAAQQPPNAPDPLRPPSPGDGAPQPLPGSEAAALAHLQAYCAGLHPHHYKATRNALMGEHTSSRWSPWLATGALSARQAMAAIRQFETEHGANDGTYWLWFELLWRDHFRWLHCKHGTQLYREQGLRVGAAPHIATATATVANHAERLARWCEGRTGHALVDAGMRELAATGWLSNRMRQIVASFWVHDLGGDWRAGAAWFEHALIDYDPCSNQGNWLYLAGRGTDPRGGRRFNPDKQAAEHDPDGQYRSLWSGQHGHT